MQNEEHINKHGQECYLGLRGRLGTSEVHRVGCQEEQKCPGRSRCCMEQVISSSPGKPQLCSFWGFFFFLVITRVWIQDFAEATPPVPFALVFLEIASWFLPILSWTTIILFYTSHHCWDDRCLPPCPAFSVELGSCEIFLPRLAWNHDPPKLSLLCSWDNSQVLQHPAVGWDEISWTCCLGWLWTVILLISASQIARLIGISH
jgi:hypothetical protein